MKRKVVCTSTGCLDYAPERYKKYDIDILRLSVTFKGKDYTEGYDIVPEEFYKELETLKDAKNNLPRTSMPTLNVIKKVFENAVFEGVDELFVVSLSAYLSGTYNALVSVSKEYENRLKIHVIDSKICSFNEGLMAIKIAEMIENNLSTEEILKEVDWIKSHQEFIAVDGKLDYLIYNGRLKGGKALIGKMMCICPVVGFNHDGELGSITSVRTVKKALQKQVEMKKENIGTRDEKDYVLWHVYTGDTLLPELERIEKEYGIKCNHEPMIMAPVCGCSNGPWLAGYGYMPIRKKEEQV